MGRSFAHPSDKIIEGSRMKTEPTGQVSDGASDDATIVSLSGKRLPRSRPGGRDSAGSSGAPEQRPVGMPLLRTVLGALLRRERHRQRRTLAELAVAAGVSVPYLSEMERGRKDPSSEMLAAVAAALGLDLMDLVARTHDELAAQASAETVQEDLVMSRPVTGEVLDGGQPLGPQHPATGPSSRLSGAVLALAA